MPRAEAEDVTRAVDVFTAFELNPSLAPGRASPSQTRVGWGRGREDDEEDEDGRGDDEVDCG